MVRVIPVSVVSKLFYCDDSEGGRKTPGKWYHIAIVYDGTKSSTKEAYKMYINGVRETLTPADNSYEDCAPNSSLNLTDVGGNDKALLIGRSGDSYRVGYCKSLSGTDVEESVGRK